MSDNHEKFQNGFDPNNGSEPVNTNTSANNAVNSTNAYGTYHNAQYPTNNTPAYTWNAQSAPQQNARCAKRTACVLRCGLCISRKNSRSPKSTARNSA